MKSSLHKNYAWFILITCGLISLIGIITLFFPDLMPAFNSKRNNLSDEDKSFAVLLHLVFSILAFLPPMLSLIGYYLYGAIGNTKVSNNMFGSLIFALAISIASVTYLASQDHSYVFDTFYYSFRSGSVEYTILISVFVTLIQLFVFPVAFTTLALFAKSVNFGQRLLPIFSMVLAVTITVFIAVSIHYSYEFLGHFGELISRGAINATIQQWFMIGSIAWTLFSISILRKSNIK